MSVIKCPNLAQKIACVKMLMGLISVFAKLVLLWKMASVEVTADTALCSRRSKLLAC